MEEGGEGLDEVRKKRGKRNEVRPGKKEGMRREQREGLMDTE